MGFCCFYTKHLTFIKSKNLKAQSEYVSRFGIDFLWVTLLTCHLNQTHVCLEQNKAFVYIKQKYFNIAFTSNL